MPAGNASEPRPMSKTSLERVSDRELVIARTFNGPARVVFDAYTKPEFVRQWWAPLSFGASIVSVEADVRVGGKYRYVLKSGKGDIFAFSGSYLEVAPHSRLVYTTFFEPKGEPPASDDEAVMVTVTLDEQADGRTHLVAREVYPSKAVLDQAIASGMERGVHVTMDQLDELVASLR
jgi:uncharacterized protein YndB with AHSA1/START domain